MPVDQFGNWHPHRRSDIRCDGCGRHFAAGTVPVPNADWERYCRDCRAGDGDGNQPSLPPF